MKKDSLFLPRVMFVLLWLLVGIGVLLFESDCLPVGFFVPGAEGQYFLHLTGLVTALAGIYLSLKLFRFRAVKRCLEAQGSERLRQWRRWNVVRLSILYIPVIYNGLTYYASLDSQMAFCLVIALLAACFCWPAMPKNASTGQEA